MMSREMKESGVDWIGEIPVDWNISSMKNYISFINGFAFESKDLLKEGKFPVIKIGDFTKENIDIRNADYCNKESREMQKYVIKNDDILIAMSGGTVGKIVYVKDIGVEAYINQRVGIIRSENSKFIHYVLSTGEFLKYIILLAGGTAQPNISTTNINRYKIAIPKEIEQQKIVNFLDNRVYQIDAILEDTKQSIKEFKIYKQSLITETVLKGLNPNVEYKYSGIEWVGKIPKHWNVYFLNQIFNQVKNKNIGLEETNLLSLSYGKIIKKDIESKDGLLPNNFEGYNRVESGDIILRMTDLQNDRTSLRVGLSGEKGIITSAYITLRQKQVINQKYAYYYLHSFDIYKGFYGMGAGVRQGVTYSMLKRLELLYPPIDEQEEIAEFLDKKCKQIDSLINEKQQLLVEFEIYKKSLIYEYVTGKKEVI